LFKKASEVNLITENINSHFGDYKKFFALFYRPMRVYDKETETYKLIVALLTAVAKGLNRHDPESSEMMFEEILLP
jgi:hypothetical protein